MLQDDTLMEPSAFFDEGICNQSILHKAHMVEKYALKCPFSKADNKGGRNAAAEANERLNDLIEKVKQDVT